MKFMEQSCSENIWLDFKGDLEPRVEGKMKLLLVL